MRSRQGSVVFEPQEQEDGGPSPVGGGLEGAWDQCVGERLAKAGAPGARNRRHDRKPGPWFAFKRAARLNFLFKDMALTLDEVRKIAALARLRLTPEEEERFAAQLGHVVDYIDQLGRYAPAEGESAAPIEASGHEAEDLVAPCLPRELFLANAPAAMDGFLLVPEVKASEEA